MSVRLTIIESSCRSGYHRKGDVFIVDDLCPVMCHELWHSIYPNVCTLLNGGTLDYGETKAKCFEFKCPDQGRVIIKGEVI